MKKGSPWRYVSTTEFYKQCLENNHDPKIYKTSFDLLYVICEKCMKVWRFRITALQWITINEFLALKYPSNYRMKHVNQIKLAKNMAKSSYK